MKTKKPKRNRYKSTQRDIQTNREVLSFKRGVESHKTIVGPSIKRRAALVGLVFGVLLGGALSECARLAVRWANG